ncbi:hypothetical protein GCM10007171_03080 [Dickeya fangzhongdai]|nr:hypothetical protein GCM10007171_03080 [Dickeya fangzhongdai]
MRWLGKRQNGAFPAGRRFQSTDLTYLGISPDKQPHVTKNYQAAQVQLNLYTAGTDNTLTGRRKNVAYAPPTFTAPDQ